MKGFEEFILFLLVLYIVFVDVIIPSEYKIHIFKYVESFLKTQSLLMHIQTTCISF